MDASCAKQMRQLVFLLLSKQFLIFAINTRNAHNVIEMGAKWTTFQAISIDKTYKNTG